MHGFVTLEYRYIYTLFWIFFSVILGLPNIFPKAYESQTLCTIVQLSKRNLLNIVSMNWYIENDDDDDGDDDNYIDES